MKHKPLNQSKEKVARRERMKGRRPHSIGKRTRGQSPASCFLRPYMDTKPTPRRRHELRKMGWTFDKDREMWTAPDGTEVPETRVLALSLEGRLPGNRKTKRAARKAAR